MVIKPEQRNTFIFLAVLFIYLVYMSWTTHLWNDEHVFYRFSWFFQNYNNNFFADIINYSKQAFHPPLYLTFLLIYTKLAALIAEPSVFFLRFPSILATCFSIYYILKDLQFKTKYILLLFIILSFQVQVFFYAFDLGPYAITFLFSTLYITKLSETWKRDCSVKKDFFILTFYIAVLSYLHYFGTILVFCCGIVYITRSFFLKNNFRLYLITHYLGFLLFFPWLILSFSKVTQTTPANEILTNQSSTNLWFDFITSLTSFSGNSLIMFVFIFLIILSSYRNKPNLVLSFLFFLVLINLRSLLIYPLFVARYNIPLLPVLFILFCSGIDRLTSSRKTYFLYIFILLAHAPSLSDYKKSLDARWLNPPYLLEFISKIKRENTKYSFYFFFNSQLDLYPYKSVININQFDLHPVGLECDPSKYNAPAIALTIEQFCPSQLLILNGFKLLNKEYGSKIWIKDE